MINCREKTFQDRQTILSIEILFVIKNEILYVGRVESYRKGLEIAA